MSEKKPEFDAPKRVAINRVYTRTGDRGQTALVGGQRVAKHHRRIEAYGVVDELNAFVGAARHEALQTGNESLSSLAEDLRVIQHQLFNLGSLLATLPADLHPRQPRIHADDIAWLEERMDNCNATLPPLRSFVLPGGSRLNIELHLCRTVCRRAEREVSALLEEGEVDAVALRWLNRLSDAFFVWSRWVIHAEHGQEELWQPNTTARNEPAGGTSNA